MNFMELRNAVEHVASQIEHPDENLDSEQQQQQEGEQIATVIRVFGQVIIGVYQELTDIKQELRVANIKNGAHQTSGA